MFTDAASSLRHTERRRLLSHLMKLGDADPEQRAKAALAATKLLQRRGLSWVAMVETGSSEAGSGSPVHGWKAWAVELANRPDLRHDERAFVLKLAGWRSPGADGLARLREIAERVGVELD